MALFGHNGVETLTASLVPIWMEVVNVCVGRGCLNRSNRDSYERFYRIPAIIEKDDDQMKELSERRRA